MTPKSSRTGRRIAALALLALVAVATALLLLAPRGGIRATASRTSERPSFDPLTAPPPWSRRCRVSIAAYEDGSASLYCGRRRRSFARIDAESGRITMRGPRAAP